MILRRSNTVKQKTFLKLVKGNSRIDGSSAANKFVEQLHLLFQCAYTYLEIIIANALRNFFSHTRSGSCEIISNHHKCDGGIEKSVLGHRLASRGLLSDNN